VIDMDQHQAPRTSDDHVRVFCLQAARAAVDGIWGMMLGPYSLAPPR
jgi:hypothetical protein